MLLPLFKKRPLASNKATPLSVINRIFVNTHTQKYTLKPKSRLEKLFNIISFTHAAEAKINF